MEHIEKKSAARNKKVNKIELLKPLRTINEAYAKIEEYAQTGYDSIEPHDMNFFFKCFGIFDRPQTPGLFMMRVRIPGGQLSTKQAAAIGIIATKYGNDYIDITTRMQIEFRYLKIGDIPMILKSLHAVGISSYQTGVDNFRNILNDPLDGEAFDNVISSQELLIQMQAIFYKKNEWIGSLPRKFNIGILGSYSNRNNIYGQDCAFVLALKEGEYGFNVYLGGRVGEIAQDANVFVTVKESLVFLEALITIFKTYGFRDNRNKNRLHFFIETVGMAEIINTTEKQAGRTFSKRGINQVSLEQFDPAFGKVRLKDGSHAVHVVVPSGIFTGTGMTSAANLSHLYGSGAIRLTVEQNLYILGVEDENLAKLLAQPFFEIYKNVTSIFHNHMIACAGTEHCPFGVIPNKPDAIEMSDYLANEVPFQNGKIRMYWSACPKGCGINGVGDIGFEGCKTKVNGEMQYAIHVTIGGKITFEGKEGRHVLKSQPLATAKPVIKQLILSYKAHKKENESFENFDDRVLSHYSSGAIGFMMKLNAYMENNALPYALHLKERSDAGHNERYEIFEFGLELYRQITEVNAYQTIEDYKPTIKERPGIPSKVNSAFPKELDELILKMIAPQPHDRYAVFSEIQALLKELD
jgi:ferredoxin-nitrite reductase